jgi:hypothetical protein
MSNKSNQSISRHSLYNAINAFDFSEQINTPLTVFFTISWIKLDGFSESKLNAIRERFLNLLARWFRRRGIPCAYIWTNENSRVLKHHSHFAVHVPSPQFRAFVAKLPSLIPGYAPDRYTLEIQGDSGSGGPKYNWHVNQRKGQLRYMLKGMDHAATINFRGRRYNLGDILGIQHRGQQGIVPGKRLGVSRFLGPVSRKRQGHIEIRDPFSLGPLIQKAANANEVAAA